MKWLLVLISLFLIQCTRPPAAQQACGFLQNSYKQRIGWPSFPIKLYVTKSVPSIFYIALANAVYEYNNRSEGIEYFKVMSYALDGNNDEAPDGYTTINYLNTWDSNNSGEEAKTKVFWWGNEIFEADININAYNFNFAPMDPVGAYEVDMTSLLIHELGHVLGLKHNAETGSVMNPQLVKGQVRRTLGGIDLDNLKCQY